MVKTDPQGRTDTDGLNLSGSHIQKKTGHKCILKVNQSFKKEEEVFPLDSVLKMYSEKKMNICFKHLRMVFLINIS